MIIGVCGYGGTGSSAVKDYLKEFRNIQTLDRAEAQFAFKVDGLQDLEYHLIKQYSRQMSGDYAIKRFLESVEYAKTPIVKKIYKDDKKYIELSKRFIEKITQAQYLGLDNADFETNKTLRNCMVLAYKKFIIPTYEKKTGKLFTSWPMRTMRVSICPDRFYEYAREYMMSVIKLSIGDLSKPTVLDQPFEGNNPTQSFPFFDDPYAIVVDRDPRDLYIASSYQWPDGTFMPRRDVKAFVEYYLRQRSNIKYEDDTDRVLRINLESLIFDYDKTTQHIDTFLGLSESDHIAPMKYLDPKRSIKGSQVYKKIPGHESEIEYIERHLSEYLFPFENYDLSRNNTELNVGFNWDKEV